MTKIWNPSPFAYTCLTWVTFPLSTDVHNFTSTPTHPLQKQKFMWFCSFVTTSCNATKKCSPDLNVPHDRPDANGINDQSFGLMNYTRSSAN